MIRRRFGLIAVALAAAVGVALTIGVAHAQFPGVTQQLLAFGKTQNAQVVDGPADVYIGTITLDPGSSYGGWHIHPGPVWVVVNRGELALYGPDGCRIAYAAGSAYLAEPATPYDLRNETDEPVELTFAGVIPADQPATVPAEAPAASCGG